MGRFRFSLERVLEVRTSQEREAAAALAAANRRLLEAESAIDGILDEMRGVRQARSDGSMEPSLAAALERSLASGVRRVSLDLERLRTEDSRFQILWQQAQRSKELIEKLRSRRYEEHQRLERHQADAALDEWAVQRRDAL